MSIFSDPKIFSYVIMVLYALNSARQFYARDIGQGCYWISALCITATVTFLMGPKP